MRCVFKPYYILTFIIISNLSIKDTGAIPLTSSNQFESNQIKSSKRSFWYLPESVSNGKSEFDREFDYCELVLKFNDLVEPMYVKPCKEWMEFYKDYVEKRMKDRKSLEKLKPKPEINKAMHAKKIAKTRQSIAKFLSESVKNDFILRNN